MNKYKNPEKYEQHKRRKQQQSKKPLVLRLSINIAQNDLQRLIEKAKQTILNKRQVTFDIGLKGRERHVYNLEIVSSKMKSFLEPHFVIGKITQRGRFFRTTVNKIVSNN